jgi:hypothetical protein
MTAIAITPAGLDDAPAIAAVHVTGWRETYPGLLPAFVIDGLSVERRADHWRRWLASSERLPFVRVARDGQAIVGLVLAGPTRTVTAFADRELGRALIEAAIIDARASAAAALGFWVVHGNTRARRFYEAGGAEAVAERKELLDGAEVVEVGYRLSV